MSVRTLHLTLVQANPTVGDLSGNMAMAGDIIAKIPQRDDGLIVFPELFVCGYPPEDLVLNDAFLRDVRAAIDAFAAQTAGHHVLMTCPWAVDGAIYNAVHLIGGGRILQTRFKRHLPNYGVFDEARIFSPGPLPEPIAFGEHRLGVMICEDCWYADIARHLKDRGADILIVTNASPFAVKKQERRMAVARDRAVETALPLAYVNQTGGQDDLVFDGASFVLNAGGECVAQAESFAADTLSVTFERHDENSAWLCAAPGPKPPRAEQALTYQALVTGLRDYVLKNGFPGVLLGMSGGIDSALSCAIAVDALGPDAVHAVMLPSAYTSQDSLEDAAACCAALGVSLDTVSIRETVAAVERELAHHFTDNTPDTTHQNIQSRSRGLILMALSNASGRMLLTTGNKSEIATGYATLYGDMCGGFNALKDVYKTDVYALTRWRNAHRPDHGLGPAGPVIPERIITKAPTAELRPGQTDQDSLPPYDVLDAILYGLVEDALDVGAVAARGHDRRTVEQVARLLRAAEHKRRQSAPGPKISPRAFGRERRYPVTNGYRGGGN